MNHATAGPPEAELRPAPATARVVREVGIDSPEELRRVGATMACRIVRCRFPEVTGYHWNGFLAEETTRLRAEADGRLNVGSPRGGAA